MAEVSVTLNIRMTEYFESFWFLDAIDSADIINVIKRFLIDDLTIAALLGQLGDLPMPLTRVSIEVIEESLEDEDTVPPYE